MPDRIPARAIIVALLLMLTVAAIGSLGPRGGARVDASAVTAVFLVLELILACLLTALRWRHTPVTEVADRLNQILRAVLIGGLVVVPVVYLIFRTHPNVALHGRSPVRISPVPVKGTPPRTDLSPHSNSVGWRELLIVLLIIAVVTAAIIIWRNRTKLSFNDPRDLVPAPESELARAVESGRAALSEIDDARAAIIACYVAMETSLADAGTKRGLAETPDELLERATAAGQVPAHPARTLTGLFYEARFSTHPMPPAQRRQAEQALSEIAGHLPIGQSR
jgi:Domain of unknown function (DUF4129)